MTHLQYNLVRWLLQQLVEVEQNLALALELFVRVVSETGYV